MPERDPGPGPAALLGRAAMGAAGALLLAWVIAFAARGQDSLPFLTAPVIAGFAVAGAVNLGFALIGVIALAPLTPVLPFLLGVRNFSLAEIALLSAVGGAGLVGFVRGASAPARSPALLPLAVFCVAVVSSTLYMASRTYAVLDPFFPAFLKTRLVDALVPYADRRDHFLRVGTALLEGAGAYVVALAAFRGRPRACTAAAVALAVSGGLVGLFGVLQYATGIGMVDFWQVAEPGRRRVNATWPDVNSCGAFLGMAAFVALGLVLAMRRRPARLALALACAATIIGIILTGSRSALLGVVPGVIVWLAASRLKAPAGMPSTRRILAGAVLLFIIVIPSHVALSRLTPESRLWQPLHSYPNPLNAALKGRLNLWRSGLLLWSEDPYFGQGLGTTIHRMHRYHDPTLPYWNPPTENAHNWFLQVGLELGWAGLVPLALAIILAIGAALRVQSPVSRSIGAAAVVVAAASVTGHPLLVHELYLLFWLLLGVAIAGNAAPAPEAGTAALRPDKEPSRATRLGLALAIAASAVIVAAFAVRSRKETADLVPMPMMLGFHALEQEPDGRRFRWTSGDATVRALSCLPMVSVGLENPFGAARPATVTLSIGTGITTTVKMADSALRVIELPGPDPWPAMMTFNIHVEPVINPARDAGAGDRRDLGIKVLRSNFGLVSEDIPDHKVRLSEIMGTLVPAVLREREAGP